MNYSDSRQLTTVYELPLPEVEQKLADAAEGDSERSLSESFLVGNVLWYCRLRWIVVAALIALGLLGFFPEAMKPFGLALRSDWPLATAGVLIVANTGFILLARRCKSPNTSSPVQANLWFQIALDLIVLTIVVHFVGSLETYAPFGYLGHIVLACIFLSPGQSLGVTTIAGGLYLACIAVETSGVLAPVSIFDHTILPERASFPFVATLLHVCSALMIWLVVWYLTSKLSGVVRRRGMELAEANRRLVEAGEERSKHMLRTTHELKAPFAAIHAGTQLLMTGRRGTLPKEAREVIERIAARCQRLSQEIKEMLQLANLRSGSQQMPPHVEIDLAKVIKWCVAQVDPMAMERRVSIRSDLQPVRVVAIEDYIKMMLDNILSNAVAYSNNGGAVYVGCRPLEEGGAEVTIQDQGIGIPGDKLPHIFDDYYRTNEAARHNKASTGLGLAIVRHVAQVHRIRVRVESTPGCGTTFILNMRPVGA
jgi:signal transduction histidine kinase